MLANSYEIRLLDEEVNHFMYLSYMLDGLSIVLRCIAKAENYEQELFCQNKKELIEFNMERNLLVSALIRKYIPKQQQNLMWDVRVDPDMEVMYFKLSKKEDGCHE